MNVAEYTHLINKPNSIQEKHTDELARVLDDFPYFQSARAIRLKGLYNQDSFKYNYALKVTAAHTTDRSVLFDFIISDAFANINLEKAPEFIKNETQINTPIFKPIEAESITTEIENSNVVLDEVEATTKIQPQKIEVKNSEVEATSKPFEFSITEKHSFQEWLQLSKISHINRATEQETDTITEEISEDKKKKADLIDKFIEASPKIPPVKHGSVNLIRLEPTKTEPSDLMTETLARVYLEQKKYQKAIQAYQILILKYPEKSSFFANRISEIEILQNNNK